MADTSATLLLRTEPIGKLLLRYSLPAIAAMVVFSLYNIIDSIFIGHGVGPLAISGLAITFPVMNLTFALVLLGGIGALCGFGTLTALETFAGPLSGSLIQAFGYIVAGGLVSLIVTFGLAHKLHIPEASFITNIAGKVFRKLRRR